MIFIPVRTLEILYVMKLCASWKCTGGSKDLTVSAIKLSSSSPLNVELVWTFQSVLYNYAVYFVWICVDLCVTVVDAGGERQGGSDDRRVPARSDDTDGTV